MRIAAIAAVAFALVAIAAVTGYTTRGDAAEASPAGARAVEEVEALQKAEADHFKRHGRYSERLADLFSATRFGTDIVMNAGGLDINLDVSTDGKTVIVRVDSPAITLSRVLVNGRETGRTCEALEAGAFCP
jgi:hypothetical protein